MDLFLIVLIGVGIIFGMGFCCSCIAGICNPTTAGQATDGASSSPQPQSQPGGTHVRPSQTSRTHNSPTQNANISRRQPVFSPSAIQTPTYARTPSYSHRSRTTTPITPQHTPDLTTPVQPPQFVRQQRPQRWRLRLSSPLSFDDLRSFEATGDLRESPCPVCLEPLVEQPISCGQCLHFAHRQCLTSWLVRDAQTACPVCRVAFTDDITAANDAVSAT